ncbi:MAG: molybdopterin-dependent oxidoreductase, partial [Acidobacteria bacterium]|nr:molybdopterin-dependent oxidoreductase [Acidobacteriota bacterium]
MPELPPLSADGVRSEIGRRNFLKFMLAGGAATMVGCTVRGPSATLVSNVDPPEEWIPGRSVYYASVCRECPAGCGLHVCNRDGRVVKIEGNPHHPISRGALCARGQAALQGLYDPDRLTRPLLRKGAESLQPANWDEGIRLFAEALSDLKPQRNPGELAFVSGALGPAFSSLVRQWMDTLGGGRLIQYEAFGYEFLKAANQIAFNSPEIPHFVLEKARLILSLGADFLETWLSPVEFSGAFSTFRAYQQGQIGRLVQVESRCSLTGANADDWLLIRPGTEYFLVLALVHIILAEKLSRVREEDLPRIQSAAAPFDPETASQTTGISSDVIYDLARSFARERPSVALFGGVASTAANATATQVAVNLLNYAVGNVGETVVFGAGLYPGRLSPYREMLQLVEEMNAGRVNLVIIHNSNPAFTLPPETGFQAALEKVRFVVVLSPYMDETAALADLVLPTHTPLESWDDYSPREGIRSLQQPAMRPLLDSRHAGDLLLEAGRGISTSITPSLGAQSYYQFLRERWKELQFQERPDLEFESFWKLAAAGGGVWKEFSAQPVALNPGWKLPDFQNPFPAEERENRTLALIPCPSILHYDGRGANKAWLQEIPEPLTEVVWDSCAEIHPQTAQEFGLRQGDAARLRSPYGEITLPVYLQPWIHPEAVAVPLGQGHSEYGRHARARGANATVLLGAAAETHSGGLPWLSARVQMQRADTRHPLVSTRGALSQTERRIAQLISLDEMRKVSREPDLEESRGHEEADLYAPHPHPEHQWGMVIDLNACTGCKACTAACYAENNIPVVGKEQVALGREMSWIRIESYAEESPVPNYIALPMLCQHCHHAPCEAVCPVFATYHNAEGLNAMVYNR